ncbi:MAG: hypothetical protein K2W95_09705 [Candidatus Obscuribacterales bacterium]|nr:hypothetical protein [Candidatus Obscuribacterales bacterium]
MHKIQKIVVLLGLGALILMCVYPPWVFVDADRVQHPMGYAPLWKPPVTRSQSSAELLGFKLQLNVQTQAANNIDLYRLLAQIAILAAVTGGSVFLLKRASV